MAALINWRLTIKYDGGRYYGWQIQPDKPSVQAEITNALKVVLREPVVLTAAGRTDAGVHADAQVANFKTAALIEDHRLRWKLNAVLPDDIVISDIEPVGDDFDARRSALKRTYSYLILNRPFPSPFWRRQSWWVAKSLDLRAADEAARSLVGIHDFSGFTIAKEGSRVREIKTIDIIEEDQTEGLIRIRVSANAFLHHMVRLIVGTLVDVGAGRLPASITEQILISKDVRQAGPRAPAKGLRLEKVEY